MKKNYCDSFKNGQSILERLLEKFGGNDCFKKNGVEGVYDENGELYGAIILDATAIIESESDETPVKINVWYQTNGGEEVLKYLKETVKDTDIEIIDGYQPPDLDEIVTDFYENDDELISDTVKKLKLKFNNN